jgi:signal transduction histidine kinase
MTTPIRSARSAGAASHPSPVSANAARAHEQKNCLSIILAVASLVTPELSPQGRERMQRLRAAAHRMRDLLNADLDESGDGTGDVEIEHLFETVCESLRDQAEAADVRLIVDCGGGVLRASESELREALFNLVSNAVAAAPPKSSVLVETEITDAGEHRWYIQDRGVGMCPEVLDQIGVPHRSFRQGGSGLGVAIARAIIERHGGTLRFESVSGRGTTVTICLPREQRQPMSGVCARADGGMSKE